MDRNVVRYRTPAGVRGVDAATTTPDPPAHEKLMKYFPEAALALYIAADPVIQELLNDKATKWALWGLLLLSIVFCFAYLAKFWDLNKKHQDENPHYFWQKVISAVALVAYIAAIGGPFAVQWSGYNRLWGTLAAILITTFIVFVRAPTAPAPPAPPDPAA